MSDKFTGNR